MNAIILVVRQTLTGGGGDVGVYNSSGTLVLNGGSGSVSQTTGLKQISPIQVSKTLAPGQYYVAITWPGKNGNVEGASTYTAGAVYRTGIISGAGGSALPASINLNNITPGVDLYEVALHN